MKNHYDVVILGAGLAGLTLSRHLLLDTEKTVLLLERKPEVPPRRQKVGESTVQLAGYYLSRVLDLEEHLLGEHFMKYNLRFYWKSAGRANDTFEDYSHSFIRLFSNVASYQVDRNVLEGALLAKNLESDRFTFQSSVKKLDVTLAEDAGAGPHEIRFEADSPATATASWVVDTSGRSKFLTRKLELGRKSPVHHGAFWWWVDGLVDVEKLSRSSRKERRLRKERAQLGHVPFWLATNHFLEPGLWLWVIPLRGKTSLGLVFDKNVVDFTYEDVSTPQKATDWVVEHFPLFERDLPHRKVLDFGGFKDFSYDCAQTLSAARWALTGEAGRFGDPLYSPGSDLIAIHNTLIVDAVTTENPVELEAKCPLYESLVRAVYQAYLPTYVTSYDALGDQETMTLKYTWELSIYFGVYVFPFINDLFTDRRFLVGFLRTFQQLGPINQGIQKLISGFFRWKEENAEPAHEPRYFDFTEVGTLREAEKTFYKVGLTVDEAKKVLNEQMRNFHELARFIAAHVASVVLGDGRILTSRRFIEDIDVRDLDFEPEKWRERWKGCAEDPATFTWSFHPFVLERFRTARLEAPCETAAVEEVIS